MLSHSPHAFANDKISQMKGVYMAASQAKSPTRPRRATGLGSLPELSKSPEPASLLASVGNPYEQAQEPITEVLNTEEHGKMRLLELINSKESPLTTQKRQAASVYGPPVGKPRPSLSSLEQQQAARGPI